MRRVVSCFLSLCLFAVDAEDRTWSSPLISPNDRADSASSRLFVLPFQSPLPLYRFAQHSSPLTSSPPPQSAVPPANDSNRSNTGATSGSSTNAAKAVSPSRRSFAFPRLQPNLLRERRREEEGQGVGVRRLGSSQSRRRRRRRESMMRRIRMGLCGVGRGMPRCRGVRSSLFLSLSRASRRARADPDDLNRHRLHRQDDRPPSDVQQQVHVPKDLHRARLPRRRDPPDPSGRREADQASQG